VRIFYSSLEELGEFTEVTAGNLPESAQKLLWHEDLMTITLETYHSCPVDVEVLDTVMTGTHYARRVFLKCRPRGRILHFGIVRVNLACLSEEVRRDIAAGTTPVGRALVQHDVLREVRLLSLWSVVPGPELRRIFGASRSQPCYGRTALIYCDDAPAVEVLEILPAG
jgi:chorismate-pyruvate lyase